MVVKGVKYTRILHTHNDASSILQRSITACSILQPEKKTKHGLLQCFETLSRINKFNQRLETVISEIDFPQAE